MAQNGMALRWKTGPYKISGTEHKTANHNYRTLNPASDRGAAEFVPCVPEKKTIEYFSASYLARDSSSDIKAARQEFVGQQKCLAPI